MNSDDIMSMWVNNDDMNLCDYCTEKCLIGDKCVEFKWNGVIPKVEPPHHVGCKHGPAGLCRYTELDQETFGDLDGLFKTVPCLRRFQKDML